MNIVPLYWSLRSAIALACIGFSSLAFASELRPFCVDRPGKGTPPCVLDAGHVQVETSLVDFTRDRSNDFQTDTTLIGDFLLRVGLLPTTELRIGWTPVGVVRTRDLMTNVRIRESGTGDLSLGFRTGLKNPDGGGFSIALQPSISVPIGGTAIGAGTWGATLIVPVSYAITNNVQLALSPEIDATPDDDGSGRHLHYGSVVGISAGLTKLLTAGVELAAFRDNAPAGGSTAATASFVMAFQPPRVKDFQIDAGFYAGLNRDTPDAQFVLGIAKRF